MQNTKIAETILSYFPDNYNGIFVEVGAAHPVNISVSFCFRPLAEQKRMWHFDQAHELDSKEPSGKWKIISVEPNPEFCDEFKKMDIPVLQYAACGEDKGKTTFK